MYDKDCDWRSYQRVPSKEELDAIHKRISDSLPYARRYAEANKPSVERIAMLAAFEIHDAIYGHSVSRDRVHESGKSYHEWLKGIVRDAIAGELK